MEFLIGILDYEKKYSRYLFVPCETAQAIKAEFRVMYFVHGRSTIYNYEIMRHMFANKSEAASAVGTLVRLRSLEDSETDENLRFPYFL